jgi:hypothetical protein
MTREQTRNANLLASIYCNKIDKNLSLSLFGVVVIKYTAYIQYRQYIYRVSAEYLVFTMYKGKLL